MRETQPKKSGSAERSEVKTVGKVTKFCPQLTPVRAYGVAALSAPD